MTIRIRNVSEDSQYIITEKGVKITLLPHEERECDDKIANQFLENCRPLVEKIAEFNINSTPYSVPEIIWLANMTGDPDEPEHLNIRIWNRKEGISEYKKIPNDKRTPRPVSEPYSQGEIIDEIREGVYRGITPTPETISIQPYQRKAFSQEKGTFLLNRALQYMDGMSGALIRSRAPSDFEPTTGWSLDKMRAYLYLVDEKAILGLSEAECKEKAVSHDQYKKDKTTIEKMYIEEAKTLTMKRIYFRLVNPKYKLPSKLDFDRYTRGRSSK